MPLGNLPSSLCSSTLYLQVPNTHITEKIGTFLLYITEKPSLLTTNLKNINNNFCRGKHLACLSLHPWVPTPCSMDSQPPPPPKTFSCLSVSSFINNSERLLVDTNRFLIYHENKTSPKQLPHQTLLQPLTAAALAGSLGFWVQDLTSKHSHTFLLCTFSSACLEDSFLRSSSTYMCRLANWTGTCTSVFLTPQIHFANGSEQLPIPLTTPT